MELYRPHGKNHLTNDDAWSWLKKAALPLVVAGASVVAAPLVLSAAGFGAGGIVAGSLAAKGMSAIAMSNGVGVAAGGFFRGMPVSGSGWNSRKYTCGNRGGNWNSHICCTGRNPSQ
ncbi:uncharacterized protein LOC128245625 isoform X2 [Mya arenaria]|uniref:uncharacterized protein LOC128245625 isoform X2 n=1 Tax=Mya arenaria TaxID=6604 RepID=UPI0022E270AD|nr:uncharacterized protein LOC128245625 isoform X2 [Mya arenaria]